MEVVENLVLICDECNEGTVKFNFQSVEWKLKIGPSWTQSFNHEIGYRNDSVHIPPARM